MPFYVYILKCVDGTYYTGSTNNLSHRLYEHQNGADSESYTSNRRPVELVWSEEVSALGEALNHEHQIKGWSRAKKEALIQNDFDLIHETVKSARKKREGKKSDDAKSSELF